MANTFKSQPFSSLYVYTRPTIASYEDQNGVIQQSNPNQIRREYKDGYLWGIKFGDKDSMRIPLFSNNTAWLDYNGVGTFVITANAPAGYTFLKCGTFEVQGHGTLKTTIHPVNTSQLAPSIELFGDAPNFIDDEGHVLIVKFYHEDIDFTAYEEYTAMNELNTFVHGVWT